MNARLPTDAALEGHWFVLPSGALVEVCSVTPTAPGVAQVRYVNEDGMMTPVFFDLCITFLLRFGKSHGFVPNKLKD